jgi:23S rRNA (guanosine2251-2'-O)-methyltransferase
MRRIVLIAHNLRSCHNIGALLRTAEGLGVERVYMTGYTPYPQMPNDTRLPHLARKINTQIHKTALDAEHMVPWEQHDDVISLLARLRQEGYNIAALEQTPDAISLPSFRSDSPIALLLGREVEGIEPEVLAACTMTLEIPMLGKKESFNVASAAAMALYQLRFPS